jgi:hypothetical protein
MVYIFFNVPYVVFYHLAKLELKTPLVYREIKRQIMSRGKLDAMIYFRGEPRNT